MTTNPNVLRVLTAGLAVSILIGAFVFLWTAAVALAALPGLAHSPQEARVLLRGAGLAAAVAGVLTWLGLRLFRARSGSALLSSLQWALLGAGLLAASLVLLAAAAVAHESYLPAFSAAIAGFAAVLYSRRLGRQPPDESLGR